MRHDALRIATAVAAMAAITWIYTTWLHVSNTTTVAMTFLLVVLVVAATSRLRVAVIASIAAMLAFNFFFLPPVGTLTIADPENWVALFAFLAVSLVASKMSAAARDREALAVARKGEQLKSALLASLSHDLRTPLTAIRVAATNLKDTTLAEADRLEQTGIVLSEVERLTRLFQNILDMTRIDAGAVESRLQWVHPLEVVEAARDQVEHSLRGHPLEMQSRDDVLVKLDPRLTTAALSHVLENAAQYSDEGAPICIATSVRDDEFQIHVRDHGRGISAEDMPNLFRRFYRGSRAVQYVSGTGMGLSIARGLLAVEGARIWAENAKDGGAVFRIAVPLERRAAS
jgi:two-component system sensor histidine kinase KdpD